MRRRIFYTAMILLTLLAGAAIAMDVHITGDITGTYTLNSLSVSSDGTITLDLGSGGPPPPVLSLSLSPTTLPTGTVDDAYSQNVTMSASNGTTPYTYSCSTSGTGISASVGASANVCSISGTPTTAGTYSVNFRVDDDSGDVAQKTSYFTVNSPGTGNEPPIKKVLTNGQSVRFVPIKAGASHYYKFTIPESHSGSWHGMLVSMGTNDWRTNQDMMFSLGLPEPTTNDYPVGQSINLNGEIINGSQKWASISQGTSNESVQISSGLPAGTYYIMVYNTSNVEGSYELYYSAW